MKAANGSSATERLLLVYERLRGLLARRAHAPLLVFGNQKSGTSAVAAILGRAVGQPVRLDFIGAREPMLSRVLSGQQSLESFVKSNAWAFSYPIVKEPGLTPIAIPLLNHFTLDRGLFVVRNPWSNIRSICNRLGLDGQAATVPDNARLNATWRKLLTGGQPDSNIANPIEGLALRWREIASVYLSRPERFVLVRYEDFCQDKRGEINRAAVACGLEVRNHVSQSQLDRQYQPGGTPQTDLRTFFGKEHFELIGELCSEFAARFEYPGEPV